MALAMLITLLPNTVKAEQVSVRYTSPRNCFISFLAESPVLSLPVEEAQNFATVRVLVDGVERETLKVSLAGKQVDYNVPLLLDEYKGKNVVLEVITEGNDLHSENIKNMIFAKEMRFSDTFDTANREPNRPLYHHTPQWGWMNDPNGMFFKDGLWHLYYQHNPYGSKWQNLSWGHSTSTDLVHWKARDEALRPDALGMVFSGSSVVDKDNTAGFGKDAVVSIFTSANVSQVQSLAYSLDEGKTFQHYTGNPIIAYEKETRDPNMFFNEKTGEWVLLLASALEHEMVIFTSKDLKTWQLKSRFGKGYGSQDGVWECPDLMPLNVRGEKKPKWALICNINPGFLYGGSGTQYFTGDFDGETFTADTKEGVTKWMDYGKDHYATVSFSNAPQGRHTVLAWMSNWQYAAEVPTKQFRSANSLPRDLDLFRGDDKQLYVGVTPSPEVESLRDQVKDYKRATLSQNAITYDLPKQNAGCAEVVADMDLRGAEGVSLVFENEKGERSVVSLSQEKREVTFDRTMSGKTDFSADFPAKTTAPIRYKGTRQKMRIFLDRCSVEVFEGEGRYVMTNLVFPTAPYTKVSLSASKGTARLNSLEIWSLK